MLRTVKYPAAKWNGSRYCWMFDEVKQTDPKQEPSAHCWRHRVKEHWQLKPVRMRNNPDCLQQKPVRRQMNPGKPQWKLVRGQIYWPKE